MQHKNQKSPLQLFQSHLDQILNMDHPLIKLSHAIDWSVFESEFGPCYSEDQGRPAKPIRLMVGLHYLKHAFNESDESVVERFLENPYWQYFCGFEYFEHELPLDPTSLVKWRKRVGAEGLDLLLKETVETAKRSKVLKRSDLKRANVDTTVQEKAIAFPTDSALYHKMRVALVKAAKVRGINLRQNYSRVGKKALFKQNRYRHAGQHKRARRMTKKLKTILGRVVRDIRRKSSDIDADLDSLLCKADRLLSQQRDSKNKLYAIHAPEVECISKGKAHKKYEFGVKVSVVSTSRGNWILSSRALHGNPYDGHTLAGSIAHAESVAGVFVKHVHVDKGYRKHDYVGEAQVHISGMGPRKKSRWDKLWRRRRSAIEPVIGHAKHDNRMIRNYLKGKDGDKMNAILAGCGYNLRKLLRAFFLSEFFAALFRACRRFGAFCYPDAPYVCLFPPAITVN
jgi:IS5 family transposase